MMPIALYVTVALVATCSDAAPLIASDSATSTAVPQLYGSGRAPARARAEAIPHRIGEITSSNESMAAAAHGTLRELLSVKSWEADAELMGNPDVRALLDRGEAIMPCEEDRGLLLSLAYALGNRCAPSKALWAAFDSESAYVRALGARCLGVYRDDSPDAWGRFADAWLSEPDDGLRGWVAISARRALSPAHWSAFCKRIDAGGTPTMAALVLALSMTPDYNRDLWPLGERALELCGAGDRVFESIATALAGHIRSPAELDVIVDALLRLDDGTPRLRRLQGRVLERATERLLEIARDVDAMPTGMDESWAQLNVRLRSRLPVGDFEEFDCALALVGGDRKRASAALALLMAKDRLPSDEAISILHLLARHGNDYRSEILAIVSDDSANRFEQARAISYLYYVVSFREWIDVLRSLRDLDVAADAAAIVWNDEMQWGAPLRPMPSRYWGEGSE